MSLNEIEIPPALLAELYSSVLIIDEKINPALMPPMGKTEVEDTATSKSSLGENRKNILVIVKYTDHPVVPDDDLKFLIEILHACKLSLADVVISNIGAHRTSFRELKKKFDPKHILLFGVTLEEIDIPIRFPEFQVQSHMNQQFLSSPSLANMKEDKILKSKLWVSLRKLFNI